MDDPISAADANRNFSQLLRSVREDRATYVVTSHGKPVARIVPFEDEAAHASAHAALLARLRAQPACEAKRWTRDELYDGS